MNAKARSCKVIYINSVSQRLCVLYCKIEFAFLGKNIVMMNVFIVDFLCKK